MAEKISTGNRTLDMSIMSILSVFIAAVISATMNMNNIRDVLNMIIYRLWGTDDITKFDPSIYFLPPAKERVEQTSKILKEATLYANYNTLSFVRKNKITTKYCVDPDNSNYSIIIIYYYNNNFVFYRFHNDSVYSTDNMVALYYSNLIDTQQETKSKEEHNKVFVRDDSNIVFEFKYSLNKTFDSIYFDKKNYLLSILNKFKEKTLYPKSLSIDNKLGILLYGPPGTGKTGTIAAIANYLKRPIFYVDLTKRTTVEKLDKIFDNAATKNGIIVLEEFDCMMGAIEGKTYQAPVQQNWGEMLAFAEGEERKQILESIRKNKPIADNEVNLQYLLTKLDGLQSVDNRLIIATTNNPDKINKALLRPGRFDIKLCLGNCSFQMYEDIMTAAYGEEYRETIKQRVSTLEEFKYSPLVVINTCITNSSIDEAFNVLKNNEIPDY